MVPICAANAEPERPGPRNGRDQRRKFAQHGQAHQVGYKNIGTVLP
jgi:hypothetical protein